MMITFYLIRHGQKEVIPFDPPLTTVGIKKAEVTAESLKDIPFKEVIVSPKTRTKEAAVIIVKPHSPLITINNMFDKTSKIL